MRILTATVRIVVTSLAALTFWMAGAGIAAAHTALSGSDPAADSSLKSPPTTITLTFTEDIDPTFVNVVLSGSDGQSWISGDPRVDGPRVITAVQQDLPPSGTYTVGYRVVSADGHPVSGSYTFSMSGVPGKASPASTSAGAAPTTTAAPVTAAPAGADNRTLVVSTAVAGAALVGVVAFWLVRKSRRNARTS